MRPHFIRWFMNLWPPLLGAGIRIKSISRDYSRVDVAMRLGLLNRNIVGVHFGGSLYAMCDPFFMLIMMEQLGKDYIVWDKAAEIRFRRPGRGTVRAVFEVSPERVAEIRAAADAGPKVEPVFTVNVLDGTGVVVAEVVKKLYVRRRDQRTK